MTTELGHALEPWHFNAFGSRGGDGPSHFRIWEGNMTDGRAIADTAGYGRIDEANARRIVACVNACAGIATEELEVLADGELAMALTAFIDREVAQMRRGTAELLRRLSRGEAHVE